MLRAFGSAVRIPDLRRKLLFTVAMIGVYRVGSWLPLPGINVDLLENAVAQGGAAGFASILNVFSGGALQQMAVFALGIMPYITASIIMQLLAVVIPRLEALQREGEQGRRKITQYTRYGTIVLSLLQATGLTVLVRSGQVFGAGVEVIDADAGTGIILLIVLTLTAGTGFLMWLGELITARGVGNGMSLLIYVSIIAVIPSQISILRASNGVGALWLVLGIGIFLTVAVVFIEQGQRRIPVTYARRQAGRKTYGGQSTYIPLKVNQSGVIPVIFASSLLYLPQLLANVSGWQWLIDANTRYFQDPSSWVYIATFGGMTIFFAYFYTAIAFNPSEVADNLKRYGGYVPGLRPGTQTEAYLEKVLSRITLPGALYLTIIAVMPFVALGAFNIQSLPLGGVSLLIMVGVALETMKQVEAQLLQRNYEGFL